MDQSLEYTRTCRDFANSAEVDSLGTKRKFPWDVKCGLLKAEIHGPFFTSIVTRRWAKG